MWLKIELQEASETCYQTIRKSWSEIDKIASQPNGLSTLRTKFKTCKYEQIDPEWLTRQRETEVKIIKGWISKYYASLKVLTQ